MNIIDLENERIKLIQKLNENFNDRIKLFLISDYFELVLSTKNKSVIEAFTAEFIGLFSSLLQNTIPQFLRPEYFSKIIKLSQELKDHISIDEFRNSLSNSIEIFSNNFTNLQKKLEGEVLQNQESKIKFPVLEHFEKGKVLLGGFIESITIALKVSNEKNKFIIVPSNSNLEKKLSEQINLSWNCAINYLKTFVKLKSKFYEVIIQFDQKSGNYIGNSFGTALTILFIQNLLDVNNAGYKIKIKPGIVLTGGINEKYEILSVSDEIVEKKTELVFFSTEQNFVVPKIDELSALIKLKNLQKEFPRRKFSIIAVENLEDLFNRRNIIEIKKLSLIKKISRKLKRNWKATIIILPLLIFLFYFLYRDWDDNPAILENIENTLIVKNKVGKELWQTQIGFNNKKTYQSSYLSQFQKIIDINEDGKNEIIIANENLNKPGSKYKYSKIICYDLNKKEIWNYSFKDTISTFTDKIDTIYAIFLIDTLTIKNKKLLLCVSTSLRSFSSAIFQLDLQTGKRINSTLWNSGFFTNGLINDFNNDSKKELLASFINNGFEQVGILQIEVDKLNGQCPTTDNYKYKNLSIADLDEYILLPKTDYTHFINRRIEGILQGSVNYSEKKGKIYISVDVGENSAQLAYLYNFQKNNFEIIIGNEFRVLRDSLVVKGKLKPPLTDTDEYCNLLISQIKYWNGKEFVYRKDYKKP